MKATAYHLCQLGLKSAAECAVDHDGQRLARQRRDVFFRQLFLADAMVENASEHGNRQSDQHHNDAPENQLLRVNRL